MVEIKNRKHLKRWLKNRPREEAVVIAVRSALRVVPLLVTALAKSAVARRAATILPVLRATAVPWVAAVGPTQGTEVRKAASRADAAARVAARAAASPAAAAYAAYAAAAYAARAVADVAAADAAAADAARAAAAYASPAATTTRTAARAAAAAAWEAVSADATALEQGQSPNRLAATPLWPNQLPDWAAEAWARLEDHLLKAGEGWEVWTEWYEDRLHGRPFNKALEEARVLISEEIWQQGPKVLNAEIKRLIEKHRPKTPLPSVEDAGQQSAMGYSFGGLMDGRIELVDPSLSGEARDDKISRDFHTEVLDAARNLADECRKSNELSEVGGAIQKYLDRLGKGPHEVRKTLVIGGEMLCNLRDADLRLQQADDPMPKPMPVHAFAALQTLILAHNQYVSTDPALASQRRALMDPEEAASIVAMPDETLEALDDLAPVLDSAALEALRDAAEAAKPNTPAGHRAHVWLDQSWRNLAIETSRRVLYALRKSAEAFYDEAVIAARLTTEQAIEAARETASLALRRVKQGAAGFVAIEAGPGAVQALADFAAHVDAVGRVVRTGETIASAAATTFGAGLGFILLVAIVARHLAGKAWFVDLIDDPEVKKVIEFLRPK